MKGVHKLRIPRRERPFGRRASKEWGRPPDPAKNGPKISSRPERKLRQNRDDQQGGDPV